MLVLGAALLAVGLLLLLAEAHASTGGLIGTAAGIAAVAGIVVLLIAAGVGAAVVLVVALCLLALVVSMGVLLRRRILRPVPTRPRAGTEALVGRVGVVRSSSGREAQVFIDGALWRAEAELNGADTDLHEGEKVVVEHVEGLTLQVRRAEAWELLR
jgi:membrane protein implicated in regulation of membrane protease activity